MIQHTDQELRQLAADLAEGRIFTSDQCNGRTELASVFMVLALGALSKMTEVGLIYEYMSERHQMTANGKPIFFSCRILSKQDCARCQVFLDEYRLQQAKFLNPQR